MENNLKKEFSKRDVQRMRNIIGGNAGDRTQLQAGWEKHTEKHEEGDVWEEDGKKWTIKNGIRQNVTKLDEIKKLTMLPLTCPTCSKLIKVDDINKKMWAIHKKCFECVLKMEGEIKRAGKWEEYTSNVMNSNKNSELDDLEQALEGWVDQKDTFVSEAGEVETWKGGDKKAVYTQVKERIAELRNLDIYKGKNEE